MNIPKGLPTNARQAFKGEIFEVWQWEQRQFDGSSATYECAKRNDSVTVIPIFGEKILIQYQEQPGRDEFISLPGGFCEEDEPLKDAQREFLQETGCIAGVWKPYMVWEPGGNKIMWKSHFYIAKECKKIQDIQEDPGEKIRTDFASFDEFLTLADNPKFRHKDIVPTLLRARYIPGNKEELRKLLFG